MHAFLKTHYTQDLRQTGHFPLIYKNLNRRFWEADLPFIWTGVRENEKNPCFAPSGYMLDTGNFRRSFRRIRRETIIRTPCLT